MAPRIYIDGHAGTIGLRIRELLAGREDLEILEIEQAARKDASARKAMLDAADVAILCLPDDAAREAVALADNPKLRFIDGSTAHRVADGWVYGLPELSDDQPAAIAAADRVSNPGCYPTAVILLLRPLIDAGLLSKDAPVSVHALSGYSGGGRPLIERWEDAALGLAQLPHEATYATDRQHKHIPEMQRFSGLSSPPQFVPAVGPFRCGMRVQVPLHRSVLDGVDAAALHGALSARYDGSRFIRTLPLGGEADGDEWRFDPQVCNGTNRVELRVLESPDGHVVLMAVLDNLGKGASGAAVQSLNLMLGIPQDRGLAG